MLELLIFFLVAALIAGAFGFTGVASGAATIAKVIFFLLVAGAVVIAIVGLVGVAALA
jgi:uncharacterized membrane protein YtjA (UPF0391 family)